MTFDCGFSKGTNWFRYRTGGILVHGGRMLFVRSGVGDYYYMIGGAVRLGETSEQCIEREFFEETGLEVRADRLAVVCENFFKGKGGEIDGLDCHTLEFYYCLRVENDGLRSCKTETDIGEKLVWLPLEAVRESIIKPTFIREQLDEILGSSHTLHIVEERDR